MFKFSLNWLRDYCGSNAKYEDIMNKLKLQGFEFAGKSEINGDIITEIEVKANRPDMLSHMGIAREIKAFDGQKIPTIEKSDLKPDNVNFPVDISVNSDVCKRFSMLKINGVNASVKTPEFITERLNALGINSVNVVVDIGNYVMLDVCQPMHCYDFDKLSKKELTIHKSGITQKVTTFSGEEAEVKPEDIVIESNGKIKCVAGIIGTEDAAVDTSSKNILLEAAVFDEISVRLSSRRLKISTPSSFRFERGVDIQSTFDAMVKCANMILEVCGGTIENVYDNFPNKPERKLIKLSVNNSNSLLGTELTQGEIVKYLKKYDFDSKIETEDVINVEIPSYRIDVNKEVDLIEEVARIHGYDNIEPVMPKIRINYNKNTIWDNIHTFRETLVALGFNETISYSFIPNDTMEIFDIKPGERLYTDLKLQNPLSQVYGLMRSTMVYSLLNTLAYNYSIGNMNQGIFEIGRTYFKDKSMDTKCREVDTCGFISSGIRIQKGFGIEKDIKYSYYDLLNYVKILMDKFGQNFELVERNYRFCESHTAFDIIVNGEIVGFLGELKKPSLNKVSNVKLIKEKIFFCEIYVEKIESKVKNIKFESKYPAVRRQYNLVHKKDISVKSAVDIIKSASENVRNVAAKDIYKDKSFDDTEHSVLYEVEYCSKDSTLTLEEVEGIEKTFLGELSRKFNAKIK